MLIFYFIFLAFWAYQGFSFSTSLVRTLLIIQILAIILNLLLGQISLLQAVLVFIFLLASIWVYGNALERKIKFAGFYAFLTFLFPLLGLPIYLVVRNFISNRKLETIKDDEEGKIEIYNE